MNRGRPALKAALIAAAFSAAAGSWGRVVTTFSPDREGRTPVFVAHSGEDSVGAQYIEQVKIAVGRSSFLSPSVSGDDADVVLFVSTLDPDLVVRGRLTAAAWTLAILKDVRVYVGSGLRLCARDGIEKSAEALVTHVESLLKRRQTELPSLADHQRYISEWNQEVERVAMTLPVDVCGIKVRTAFREQLRVYLRLSDLGNLKLEVQDITKSVVANFTTEEEFARKIQAQTSKLAQCQADLAAIKKRKDVAPARPK